MKKNIKILLVLVLAVIWPLQTEASDIMVPDGCKVIRCTCYTPTGNKTASGVYPYEGICASNREHLGQVAVLYDLDMNFIGYFECRDTGSHQGLQEGSRIDIFRDNMDGVREWQEKIGDYVIVQWIDGKG